VVFVERSGYRLSAPIDNRVGAGVARYLRGTVAPFYGPSNSLANEISAHASGYLEPLNFNPCIVVS
jgi:hypothetical protein